MSRDVYDTVTRLFKHIEHGDEAHRDWLWRELCIFYKLAPAPRPMGKVPE